MATFALMDGDRVHELVDVSGEAELAKRYAPALVARMVDVTGKGVKEGMVRDRGVFLDPPQPAPVAPTLTVERLAALLVAKGLLAPEDLGGTKPASVPAPLAQ